MIAIFRFTVLVVAITIVFVTARAQPANKDLADKNFALLKSNPLHPSLRVKKTGNFWSARVGLHFRALAKQRAEGLVWF